ncbi:MAG: AAA family ATPase, partial [Clostridia bacterium]|nr:AAA family ATPase [Clostridia bacterium]
MFDILLIIWHIKNMKIIGTIEDIVFRNNENGYTILEIAKGMDSFIATGKFPVVGIGEEVELEGEFAINPKYGEQFVATNIKVSEPTSEDAIIKYLSCGLISGVGIVTATSIVNKFKDKTLSIIEKEPKRLIEVKGVSERKALEIYQTYVDIKKMQQAVMFLQKYDISINLAVKIYEVYKDKTESVLRKNPYILVEDVEGVGFKTADKIAAKMGVSEDSSFRLRAGVVFCLNELAEKQGSTVIRKDKLAEMTVGLLNLPNEYEGEVLGMITTLEIEGVVRSCTLEEEPAVANTRLYTMEKYIAQKLKMLINSTQELNADYDSEIGEFERINKISLHESQKKAIVTACKEGVSVITGGPGTGKTTIIKAILTILENHGKKITLLAPTGRAAKRMEEQTKRPASTIHRGLGMVYSNGRLAFAQNENNPLETDVVIIDEVSMIDIYVASSLLKAIALGTKVIFVGDKDQLMSVGAGNVLADIIGSGEVM